MANPSGLCTYTQGGYGGCSNGNVNRQQCLRVNNPLLYQGVGLSIGLPAVIAGNEITAGVSRYSARFTTPQSVIAFLPASSTAGTFSRNYVLPPDSKTSANIFAGQLLTLTLNIFSWSADTSEVLDILFNSSSPGCVCNSSVSALLGDKKVSIFFLMQMAHMVIGSGMTNANCDAVFPLNLFAAAYANSICRLFVNNRKAPVILNEVADLFNNAFDNCVYQPQSACFEVVRV